MPLPLHHVGIVLAFSVVSVACSPSGTAPQQPESDRSTLAEALPAPSAGAVAGTSLSANDRARVCRAAIAYLNGHSPAIMKVKSTTEASVVVRYNRPDDRKAWTNECRFSGDRVVWRTIGAFGGSEPGRWRETPDDEDVRFSIEGTKVTIKTTYSDGSSGSKTYTIG